jgi:ABC-type Na+ efflux pump permease subunit
MIRFFRSLAPFGRWVVGIGVALFLVAVIGGVRSCQMARNAKTETRLVTGQAGAAIANGSDAVETVGAVAGKAAETDALTKENADAIRNAPGADAPVADGARAAGLFALCKRAAYRRDPQCVQFTPTK